MEGCTVFCLISVDKVGGCVRCLEVLFKKKKEEKQGRKPSECSGLGLCLVYYRDDSLLQNF